MEEQEKIGITEFKIFLSENLEVDTDVDNISKQFSDEKKRLEEEFGQEVPAFYSNAKNYMMRNSVTIDSNGRIDVNVIKQVSQIAKKEVEYQRNIKSQIEIREENNKKVLEEQNNIEIENKFAQIKEKLEQMDYDNLTSDDFSFMGENIEYVWKNTTEEEFEKVVESVSQDQMQFNPVFLSILNKMHTASLYVDTKENNEKEYEKNDRVENPEETRNTEFNKKLQSLFTTEEMEFCIQNGINIDEINENYAKQCVQDILRCRSILLDEQEKNKGKISSERINENVKIYSKSPILKSLLENGVLFNQSIYQENNNMTFIDENTNIFQSVENGGFQTAEPTNAEMDNELDALFDDMFAEMEDPAEAIEMDLNEEQVEQTLEDLPEDQPQPELADEEVQNEAMEELQDERQEVEEDIEEIEEEIQEEAKEEIPEEQYEAPTFEEEKTGLAGLFSRIANSRAVKAVTNLFKPKEEQKRLNAPANQRVEDGVRFTDYESNGSLLPATIQTRNFFRNFAINTVEAVTKFAKNISGRGKQDNQVINTPTVIKSEPTKAQTEKTITQEQQQTVEKTETFNDTNKWAVSNEAIQRQDAINKAQERNNLSHVAAPKQEELQSEEDKSFEEI